MEGECTMGVRAWQVTDPVTGQRDVSYLATETLARNEKAIQFSTPRDRVDPRRLLTESFVTRGSVPGGDPVAYQEAAVRQQRGESVVHGDPGYQGTEEEQNKF